MSTRQLSGTASVSVGAHGELGTVRFNMNLPASLNRKLDEYARQNGVSKTEIVRRAFALFDAASDTRKRGEQVIFRNPETGAEREVIGL